MSFATGLCNAQLSLTPLEVKNINPYRIHGKFSLYENQTVCVCNSL